MHCSSPRPPFAKSPDLDRVTLRLRSTPLNCVCAQSTLPCTTNRKGVYLLEEFEAVLLVRVCEQTIRIT